MILHDRVDSRVVTAVRSRPLSKSEETSGSREIITFEGEESISILDPQYFKINPSQATPQVRKNFERKFTYDMSFSPASCNSEVYEKCAAPLVGHCIEGFNCSLLAYGQTGTGKTYTMMGYSDQSDGVGVIPRLCKDLLNKIIQETASPTKSNSSTQRKMSVSYCEIYNEKVFDLLSGNPGVSSRIRECPSRGAYVEGMNHFDINAYEDISFVLEEGQKKRVVASTLMNSTSSRSHAIFTIYLRQTYMDKNGTESERNSKTCLVDLAGSERASLTGVSGERLVEANNINKSLSTLGDVIKALSEKSSTNSGKGNSGSGGKCFVPYRNSVLTWLLKDSLGGNSKSTMLANISPCESSYSETISTLRYIERAKLIVNSATVNESGSSDSAQIALLQKQVLSLKDEIRVYKSMQQSQSNPLDLKVNNNSSDGVSSDKGFDQVDSFDEREKVWKAEIEKLEGIIKERNARILFLEEVVHAMSNEAADRPDLSEADTLSIGTSTPETDSAISFLTDQSDDVSQYPKIRGRVSLSTDGLLHGSEEGTIDPAYILNENQRLKIELAAKDEELELLMQEFCLLRDNLTSENSDLKEELSKSTANALEALESAKTIQFEKEDIERGYLQRVNDIQSMVERAESLLDLEKKKAAKAVKDSEKLRMAFTAKVCEADSLRESETSLKLEVEKLKESLKDLLDDFEQLHEKIFEQQQIQQQQQQLHFQQEEEISRDLNANATELESNEPNTSKEFFNEGNAVAATSMEGASHDRSTGGSLDSPLRLINVGNLGTPTASGPSYASASPTSSNTPSDHSEYLSAQRQILRLHQQIAAAEESYGIKEKAAETSIALLSSELAVCKAARDDLSRQINEYQEEIVHLKGKLIEQRAALSDSHKAEMMKQEDNNRSRLAEITDEHKRSMELLTKDSEQYHETIAALSSQLEDVSDRLAASNAERELISSSLAKEQTNFHMLFHQFEVIKDKLLAAERGAEATEEERGIKERHMAIIEKRTKQPISAALQVSSTAMEELRASHEAEVKRLTAIIESYSKSFIDDGIHENGGDANSSAQRQSRNLVEAVRELTAVKIALGTENSELKEDMTSAISKLKDAVDKFSQAQITIDQLQEQNDSMKREIALISLDPAAATIHLRNWQERYPDRERPSERDPERYIPVSNAEESASNNDINGENDISRLKGNLSVDLNHEISRDNAVHRTATSLAELERENRLLREQMSDLLEEKAVLREEFGSNLLKVASSSTSFLPSPSYPTTPTPSFFSPSLLLSPSSQPSPVSPDSAARPLASLWQKYLNGTGITPPSRGQATSFLESTPLSPHTQTTLATTLCGNSNILIGQNKNLSVTASPSPLSVGAGPASPLTSPSHLTASNEELTATLSTVECVLALLAATLTNLEEDEDWLAGKLDFALGMIDSLQVSSSTNDRQDEGEDGSDEEEREGRTADERRGGSSGAKKAHNALFDSLRTLHIQVKVTATDLRANKRHAPNGNSSDGTKSEETGGHNFNSISKALALTKLELALQASEMEQLRLSYSKLEKTTCDLKLQLASAKSRLDVQSPPPPSS